jgi:hypothetical protein
VGSLKIEDIYAGSGTTVVHFAFDDPWYDQYFDLDWNHYYDDERGIDPGVADWQAFD